MPEEDYRTLTSRDPFEALDLAPNGAYCFTIYDLEEAPDLGPDFHVSPKRKNETGRYYIGGELYSVDGVKDLGPDHDILVSNMEANHWETVIRCSTGNWQPFSFARDTILPLVKGATK